MSLATISNELRTAWTGSDSYWAAKTLDPYFNESNKMPLPNANNRKYEHMATYRGDYTIATYKQDTPIYRIGGVPVFVVYFALDCFGDPITPVETCFWSPFLAQAMIDIYVAMDERQRAAWWKKQGMWRLIHQNYRAQHNLAAIMETIRDIAAECADPDVDIMFGDASQFANHVGAIAAAAIRFLEENSRVSPSEPMFAQPE